MKLNKEIKNPKWKLYFKHEPNNIDCKHCKYQKAEDSIPTEDFEISKLTLKQMKQPYEQLQKLL